VDEPSGLDRLGVEDVAGHRLEPPRVRGGAHHGRAPLCVVHGLPVVEARLEEAEHAGHRGAQLVGHDGDELLLRLAQQPEPLLLEASSPQAPREQGGHHEAAGEQRDDEHLTGRLEGSREGLLELVDLLAEGDAPSRLGHVGQHTTWSSKRCRPSPEVSSRRSPSRSPITAGSLDAMTAPRSS